MQKTNSREEENFDVKLISDFEDWERGAQLSLLIYYLMLKSEDSDNTEYISGLIEEMVVCSSQFEKRLKFYKEHRELVKLIDKAIFKS